MNLMKNITSINLRPGILFWKKDNEYFLFDQVSLEQFKINKTAYELLTYCDGKHTIEEITKYLVKKNKCTLENKFNVIKFDVEKFIEEMADKKYLLINTDLNKEFYNYVGDNFIPGLVYWEVTNACNKKCVMCYNPSSELSKNELTLKEGIDLIDKFYNMGVSCIIFTGGEPLIRSSDLISWVGHCTKVGIETELFTNGTLITEELADRLSNVGLGYCRVSIHGSNAETHDSITQSSGSFVAAISGMTNLIHAGIKTAWSFVTNKRNFSELREVVEKAISLGCHGVVLGSLDLIGRGVLQKDLELDSNQEACLWRFLDEAIYFYGDKIRFCWGADMCKNEAWDYYVMNPEMPKEKWKSDPNRYMRFVKNSLCGVGQRSFAITSEGNITPCPALYDIVLGNSRNDDIKYIWDTSELFVNLREKLLEDFDYCGSCGMRYACVGGCRANAFHTDNSLFGKDVRRCKVHSSRSKGNLNMDFSFFTTEELGEKKYSFRSEEAPSEFDEIFNTSLSEGKGPWIPYIGVTNRIKIKK